MRRRGAIRDRLASQTTVGGRPHHLAEIDMTGCREHVEMKAFTLDVRLTINCGKKIGVNLQGDIISIVVIIAEKRRLVENSLPHKLFTLEIFSNGVEQALNTERLCFKNMLFKHRETVCRRTKTSALNIICI